MYQVKEVSGTFYFNRECITYYDNKKYQTNSYKYPLIQKLTVDEFFFEVHFTTLSQ